MIKGYKYRIYPTHEQKQYFEKSFGCMRYVYNWGLERKITEYKITKKSLTCFDLINEMVISKKHNTWLQEVGSDSLQMSLRSLDNAFKRFFREGKGFPDFKSKHNSKSKFTTLQSTHINFEDGLLNIPKCKNIKVAISQKFKGKFIGCTISKTPSGKYFVAFNVDDDKELPNKAMPKENKTVGIDLGIKHFAVLSTGEKIDNPKYLRSSEKRLAVLQRRLSRKEKGSQNRNKARIKVAKYHERIANQRDDFLHKLSSKLVAENQSIAIEDLAVKNMVKNHHLAKSISDAGWSRFREMLVYKSDWYGKNLLIIGRFEPSSKICSCGNINTNLRLKDRKWTCEKCGRTHDRDILAANNIVRFAFAPSGRREEPVELPALAGAMKQEITRVIL